MAGDPKNASLPFNCECDECRLRLAYLAGFFDGEGCVYPRNGLQVSASQVDRRPLDMLQALFGGTIKTPALVEGRRQMYYWVRYGKPAAVALRALLPWLVVKREQVEWAIEYDALVKSTGDAHYGRQVSDEVKIERERLRQLIMQSRTGAANRREDRAWA